MTDTNDIPPEWAVVGPALRKAALDALDVFDPPTPILHHLPPGPHGEARVLIFGTPASALSLLQRSIAEGRG